MDEKMLRDASKMYQKHCVMEDKMSEREDVRGRNGGRDRDKMR